MVFAGAALAGVAAGGTARAADMPLKGPAPHAPYSWTGCYTGFYFGFANANDPLTTDLNGYAAAAGYSLAPSSWGISQSPSVLAGGDLSCNWQPVGSQFVFGIEAEGGYMDLTGIRQQPAPGALTTIKVDSRLGPGYGDFAGRFGWVAWERVLFYGKAGVGVIKSFSQLTDSPPDTSYIIAPGSKLITPLVAGAGIEYAMTDRWTGRFEYLWFDHGASYLTCGIASNDINYCWSQRPSTISSWKFGASYKFW